MNSNRPNSDQAPPDLAFVETLLESARDLTQRLAQVLDLERAALVQRDMEQLREVLREKDQLITLLARVETGQLDLDQLLAGATGRFPATADQRERLSRLQQELRRQVSACRDQNHVNGRLVQRAQQSVAEVLQVITGSAAPQTYTATGAADASSDLRTIAKA